MHRLRNTRHLTRMVLLWFALAMGVAVASPLVNPQSTTLVCSVGGVMKLLSTGGDADTPQGTGGMLDCPLCLQMGAPPAGASIAGTREPEVARIVQRPVSAAVARSAAPLPGRGPPALS